MKRKKMCGKCIGTKLAAMVIAFALSITSFSGMVPGSVAYAEENVKQEIAEEAGNEISEDVASDINEDENASEVDDEDESENASSDREEESASEQNDDADSLSEEGIASDDALENDSEVESGEGEDALILENKILATDNNVLSDSDITSDSNAKIWFNLTGDLGPEPIDGLSIEFEEITLEYDIGNDDWYYGYGNTVSASYVDGKYYVELPVGAWYSVGMDSEFYNVDVVNPEKFYANLSGDHIYNYIASSGEYDLKLTRKEGSVVNGYVYGVPKDLNYSIVFINNSGERVKAPVIDGKFTTRLSYTYSGSNYKIELEGADEYVVISRIIFRPDYANKGYAIDVICVRKGIVSISGRTFDDDRNDVWYFDDAENANYQNRLGLNTINSIYQGVEKGTNDVYLPSFSLDDGDFEFHDGGNLARIYSSSKELIKYGTASNYLNAGLDIYKSAGDYPYFTVNCRKDDMIVINGSYIQDKIEVENPHGSSELSTFSSSRSYGFYASEAGVYKIIVHIDHNYQHRTVISSIIREHYDESNSKRITLSGHLIGFFGDGELQFTCDGDRVRTRINEDGYYSVKLLKNKEYIMVLEDASSLIRLPVSEYDEFGDSCLVQTGEQDEEMDYMLRVCSAYVRCQITGVPNAGEFIKNVNAVLDVENHEYFGTFSFSSDNKFEALEIPHGRYIGTLRNKVGDKVYAVYPIEITDDRDFNIDATYGDYRTRNTEARIVCNVEGVDTSLLKDTTFWFVDDESSKTTSGYSYYEIVTGLVRLPKDKHYTLVASNLPVGVYIEYSQMQDIAPTAEHCGVGKYSYTVKMAQNTHNETNNLVLDFGDFEASSTGQFKAGTNLTAGTDNRFTVKLDKQSSIDVNKKKFSDGYLGTKRVNFRKAASQSAGSVMLTTNGPTEVSIWWVSGATGGTMNILDQSGKVVVTSEAGPSKSSLMISSLKLNESGTYYIGGNTGSNYIYRIEVSEEIKVDDPVEDDVINAQKLGAKGDGVSDDTSAIRKALILANKKKLYVPAGTYCVSSIDVTGLLVDMYSDGDAVFCKSNADTRPIFQFRNCSNGKFSGIGFDAGSTRLGDGANTSCFLFEDVKNIEISNCQFTDTASETITFYGNCENINVSNNRFDNASGVTVFGKGSVKHAVIENNVANDGKGNGIVILEQGKASDSFDIAVRGNEFHNYTGGSFVQLRNVSNVRIENNYADNCKYFLMSPKPSSKNFTEPQVSDVKVSGNHGSATVYASLYTYEENPNTLYTDISFANNDFKATNGLTLYACDGLTIKNDHYDIPGNASLSFSGMNNAEINGIIVETKKSGKPVFKLNACDDVKIKNMNATWDRAMLQVTNSDNAYLCLEKVKADFSKLDKAILYSDGLQVDCNGCTNTGKALTAYVTNSKVLMLPILGDAFQLESSNDVHIASVHGVFDKGKKVSVKCATNDMYFDKGGNIQLDNSICVSKGTFAELEYNGKKWELKSTPVAISTSGDCTAAVGEKAQYTVSATGGSGKYTYRWYYSKDEGKTWNKAGFDGASTATMSFKVVARYYTYQFKCRVYDSVTKKEYYTDVLKLLEPVVASFIKTQPKDCTAKVGDKVVFKVEVAGSAKSYVWYRSKDGGKTWGKVYYDGYKTNSMTVPVEKYMDNYLFYCVITDTNGEKHETDKAKITLKK